MPEHPIRGHRITPDGVEEHDPFAEMLAQLRQTHSESLAVMEAEATVLQAGIEQVIEDTRDDPDPPPGKP